MNTKSESINNEQNELHVGDMIQVASVLFEDGSCFDIGTPEGVIKAIQI